MEGLARSCARMSSMSSAFSAATFLNTYQKTGVGKRYSIPPCWAISASGSNPGSEACCGVICSPSGMGSSARVGTAHDHGHSEPVVARRVCRVWDGAVRGHHPVRPERDTVDQLLAIVLAVQEQIAVGVLADVDEQRQLVGGIR